MNEIDIAPRPMQPLTTLYGRLVSRRWVRCTIEAGNAPSLAEAREAHYNHDMWWKPALPRGMDLAEAQATGVRPRPGWSRPGGGGLLAGLVTARALTRIAAQAVAHFRGTHVEGLPPARSEFEAAQDFGRWCLAELGVSLRIEGLDRVPTNGGLLFMWNQTSHLDHAILAAVLPRPTLSLYNNEVARVPLYGDYLRRGGNFHVDRFDEAQWRASLARAASAVRAGSCVLVSPEGTRSWDGGLLAMKRGAFVLARAAQRPIVCISVRGAFSCLPRTRFAVSPGVVQVCFQQPIEVDGEHPELESEVSATLRLSG